MLGMRWMVYLVLVAAACGGTSVIEGGGGGGQVVNVAVNVSGVQDGDSFRRNRRAIEAAAYSVSRQAAGRLRVG